jgi:hypothetical protein
MHAQNVFIVSRRRRENISSPSDSLAQQKVAHHPVFLRRKHVRAQIQIVPIAINQFVLHLVAASLPRSAFNRKSPVSVNSVAMYNVQM